ncbi:hypothetical protein FHS82_001017 [Pseudochelatococcus lubricantis]|uniref:Uncharacterized protein n=1 Tax=Pseudochelatococcus lubricantis TaxID=1538102 RepID=A0ABX0UW55_9HYPH|nr:hypothetical protein [Pseudochelatococcus lubricantis]NIJ57191.1 hypothetical protein [Pseudochelatococcus lubricantis]
MTRMEPASPAAPWLDWIEGTAFLSYLDPAGRGSFFSGARSFALVKPDVGEGDALAGDVSQKDDVVIVGDVVPVLSVHPETSLSNSSSQDQSCIGAFQYAGNYVHQIGKEV